MDIERKIEEIRRQPEHIKLRYVYIFVAISMVFVIAIWFFSFFYGDFQKSKTDLLKNQAIINDFEIQKKSLQDATKDANNSIDNLGKSISNQITTPTARIVSPTSNQPANMTDKQSQPTESAQ